VARIIASGKFRGASLLRLTSVNGRIEPHLIFRPEVSGDSVEIPPVDSRDLRERATELQHRLSESIREKSVWDDRKAALLAETQKEGFYKDSRRTAAVFDEVHRLDQFLSFVTKTESAVADYLKRLNRSGRGSKTQLEARLGELKRQVWCVQTIVRSQ